MGHYLTLFASNTSGNPLLQFVCGGTRIQVGCVVDDENVREAYGCHFHGYEESPEASHGLMLGWYVNREKIDTLRVLSLCRLANSLHKHTVLVDEVHKKCILLKYSADL
ncbi:hypothetical protein ADEAN_000540200 [Angomonas deanei]|uniref:Uncharacterized protein n=1 Tax=Angomonas deanei TaxID=59799 RepID=A0A7G2CDL3_9TRYP|nr:hypothetical protein ADEAN_000540200 [Angomonas deanei]